MVMRWRSSWAEVGVCQIHCWKGREQFKDFCFWLVASVTTHDLATSWLHCSFYLAMLIWKEKDDRTSKMLMSRILHNPGWWVTSVRLIEFVDIESPDLTRVTCFVGSTRMTSFQLGTHVIINLSWYCSMFVKGCVRCLYQKNSSMTTLKHRLVRL